MSILDKLIAEVGSEEELYKYIEIIGRVGHGAELSSYYTRSRMVVLTSIYEGKNRTINEAISCNTPVVVFKDLSKYTRGDDDAFPQNAGLYVPEFSAESLTDTMQEALENIDKFTPTYYTSFICIHCLVKLHAEYKAKYNMDDSSFVV